MKHNIFSSPLWIEEIEPEKIELSSSNFQKTFASKTISSISKSGDNNTLTKEGLNYLLSKILFCLKEIKINKIELGNIWRNIYQENNFQEIHFHSGPQFCFIVYEKLNTPQTVFLNPSFDLIQEKLLSEYIPIEFIPIVKEKDMIVFPAYLKHYVQNANNSMTISGNINIL